MSKTTISQIPLLAADEEVIKEGKILYSKDYSRTNVSGGKGKYVINTYRVITVNPTHRIFRVRCPKGCEREFSLRNGCNTLQLFGKLSSVKAQIKELIRADIERIQKHKKIIDESEKFLKGMSKALTATKESDLKVPKKL